MIGIRSARLARAQIRTYALIMFGFLIAIIWLVLILGWGGFWRADQRLPRGVPAPRVWPVVTAVIPARNEAASIAEVIAAHGASTYPGTLRVVVANDGSTDSTADLARQTGSPRQVTVIDVPPLQEGWTGKLWALQHAIRHADDVAPETGYLLLTDADIRHAPDTLTMLVSHADHAGLSLVSLMARLDARGWWGHLLIPAFILFFQKLYPFRWSNNPNMPVAAAAGGCILIRREALAAIGGIAAIRGALIDDCTLAARIKSDERRIWLGLANDEVVSLRDNRSFGSVWNMVARTAFAQLRFSVVLLALSVLGMGVLYLAPPLLMVAGLAYDHPPMLISGALAWGLMMLAYAPTLRLYSIPRAFGLTLPLAALLYTAMTIASALRYWRGRGGQWKGRSYPAAGK